MALNLLVILGALVLLVEGITDYLHGASIFARPRAWISEKHALLSELISCWYCVSFWVAVGVSLFVWGISWPTLVCMIVLHRLANYLHLVILYFLEE